MVYSDMLVIRVEFNQGKRMILSPYLSPYCSVPEVGDERSIITGGTVLVVSSLRVAQQSR